MELVPAVEDKQYDWSIHSRISEPVTSSAVVFWTTRTSNNTEKLKLHKRDDGYFLRGVLLTMLLLMCPVSDNVSCPSCPSRLDVQGERTMLLFTAPFFSSSTVGCWVGRRRGCSARTKQLKYFVFLRKLHHLLHQVCGFSNHALDVNVQQLENSGNGKKLQIYFVWHQKYKRNVPVKYFVLT